MRSIRSVNCFFNAIFGGYTSSTALAVPLPLKGKAKVTFTSNKTLFYLFEKNCTISNYLIDKITGSDTNRKET